MAAIETTAFLGYSRPNNNLEIYMPNLGLEFMPHFGDEPGGPARGFGNYYEEVTTHQHTYTVLGPLSEEADFEQHDIPSEESVLNGEQIESEEEVYALQEIELAIRDVSELDYIDHRRSPTGLHCMDYSMEEPGIQLPGGELWTRAANAIMNPDYNVSSLPALIGDLSHEITADGVRTFTHNKCAAAANFLPGLSTNVEYMGEAREFVQPILVDLDLTYSDTARDIDTAILTGGWRARGLGQISGEQATEIAVQSGLPFEELDKSGRIIAGGLGIFTTTNRFNNLKFRENHQTSDGKQIGLYSVTLGAYRDMLAAQGKQEIEIARSVMGAALFTHGLARYLGGDYLRARVVAPKDNDKLHIWQSQ